MNAAYSQNISVTVPANTRFYVILQKPAMNTAAPAPSRSAEAASKGPRKNKFTSLSPIIPTNRMGF